MLEGHNPIAMYLMASYMYYEEDTPIMADGDFDNLCVHLLENLDKYEHKHKHLVTKENLSAGSCLGVKYPSHCKSAAWSYYRKMEEIR